MRMRICHAKSKDKGVTRAAVHRMHEIKMQPFAIHDPLF